MPGEEILITSDDQPVAQLRPIPTAKPQPVFGSGKGMLTILAEDDEHLEELSRVRAVKASLQYPRFPLVRSRVTPG